MALNFPDSPSNGDTTTLNGVSYTYDSTKTVWVSTTGPITTVAVSDTAPTTPTDGDMWFNSADLKLYIRYNDGATSQWIIAAPAGPAGADSTVAGPAGPAGGDGRAGVYADMAALIAKTGMVAGDQALVTGLNKVFMYTGSAWYLVATMVNDSPTAITGVDGSYTLAKDGTATTITAVSTDPEGFALTWSYAVTSGSLGSTATVSQADNVFTVTPSTTEADAGSFSITFSVTDGATGAVNAVSAFTLAFIAQNSRYTALSVRATNTGSNQTFDDDSTSNHTITVAGDTTSSTFSPHRHGGYSAAFDTAGIYIQQTTDTDLPGDFTIECWAYFNDVSSDMGIMDKWYATPQAWDLRYNAGSINDFSFFGSDNGANGTYTAFTFGTPVINQWYHLAVSRTGSTISTYVNGTRTNTTTNSNTLTASCPTAIGADGLNGYLTDARIVKGTALYTGTTYTVPTAPLTAITNTTFLLGNLPYFKDQSASNHAITGDASLKPISPFDNAPYSEADHGASAYFDGSDDYLQIPHSTDTDLAGDFTIECWVYLNAHKNNNGLVSKWTGGGTYGYQLYATTGGVEFYSGNAGGAGTWMDFSIGAALTLSQWHHLVVSRTGSTISTYLNGTRTNTATDSSDCSASTPLRIGTTGSNFSSNSLNGYLSNVRIVNGTGLYTGTTYTVPTTPLTAVTNTKFLLNPETSISDLSQRNALICRGDVETSTTQVKFAGTKSIYFAGSDDYIHVPNSGTNSAFSLNSTKFTIEGWFYKETLILGGNWQSIVMKWRYPNNLGWRFKHNTDGKFEFRYSTNGSSSSYINSTGSVGIGVWAHVALVANNNLKLYINGVGEVLSASALPAFFDTSYDALIGALRYDSTDNNDGAKIMEYNGWMQDLRIHNNHAQYTADFTPPTQELEG